MSGPVKAWSYSRLQVWRKCPFQFKGKFIEKIPEPQSAPMKRGDDVHKFLEAYVKGRAKTKDVKAQEKAHRDCLPYLDKLQSPSAKLITEKQLAFDRDWKLLGDYFDPRVWVRVKIDLSYLVPKRKQQLAVLDYKTGQIKLEEHEEQLKLYALTGFLMDSIIEEVNTGIWYVDHEKSPRLISLYNNRSKDVPALKKYWEKETKGMLADKTYRPRPGSYCSWCIRSPHRGGDCKKSAAV